MRERRALGREQFLNVPWRDAILRSDNRDRQCAVLQMSRDVGVTRRRSACGARADGTELQFRAISGLVRRSESHGTARGPAWKWAKRRVVSSSAERAAKNDDA
jgi:hypothetical protein